MTHKYNKPPLSIDQQIEKLRSRGMNISSEDEEQVRYYLTMVGYYKLSGYWFVFQNKTLKKNDSDPDHFAISISFNDIRNIYVFDAKLRNLFMEALSRCEVAIKAAINNYTSLKFQEGSFWYLESKYFSNWVVSKKMKRKGKRVTEKVCKATYREWKDKLDENLERIHHCQFKEAYQNKYGEDDLPLWMVLELMTFGSLEKMYNLMNNTYHKKQIAKVLSVTPEQLENALAIMHLTRNKCAHYNRLYNVINGIIPADINNKKYNPEFNYSFSEHRENQALLFPIFYLLTYFLYNVSGKSCWALNVKQLIEEYAGKCPYISFKEMGFPEKWEELPLFQKVFSYHKNEN